MAKNQDCEYRVSWKREGLKPKRKQYVRLDAARRFIVLLGPEPWNAFGKDPDELDCCEGRECGCAGLSVRERSMADREGMPPVEWIKLENRTVGPWEEEA